MSIKAHSLNLNIKYKETVKAATEKEETQLKNAKNAKDKDKLLRLRRWVS
jgi:hypothetical protein